MKRFIFLSLISFVTAAAHSEDPKFPVAAIPEHLVKDVDVVIREDKMVFTILSEKTGKAYAYYAVTIFNEKGARFAKTIINYDKQIKISSIKATIYDASGKVLKKVKNSEIYDQSAYDGISLYSDARFKALNCTHGQYPYTVEIEYEKEYNYLFWIDDSYFIPGERAAVQHASYQLIYPQRLTPRYKLHNSTMEPRKEKTLDGFESVTWEFNNLTAVKFEPHSPRLSFIPYIDAAPSTFQYDNYLGDMSSWQNFGKWISQLGQGRNALPQSTIEKVKEIASKAQTTEGKVKAIYEYLQNRTRYVSIQLGIGGFQPFEASVVDNTGYGDCKALSNYMVAMLETVGIRSHYALIKAGEHAAAIDENFPSSQFNHAIVAVPLEGDTIWLECTSQTNPFGYQGTFTGDRKALLITESGGVLVNTTRYPAEANVQSRTAAVTVALTGDATARVKTIYAGLQYENDNLNFILNNQFDEQKKWIQNTTRIPAFDIVSFSMKNVKNRIPSAVVSVEFDLKRYASVSGKRLFLTPNLMNKKTYVPEKVEQRVTDVVIHQAYIDIDTIKFRVPEALYAEFLPENIAIKSQFGEYEASFSMDAGSLLYIRKLRIEKGTFPASSYNDMIDFHKSIVRADNTKIVFLSKT